MNLRHMACAVCLALIMCGCKDSKPELGAPVTVRVMGVDGRTDLDPGLMIGLYVGDPVNVSNVPMTVNEQGFAMPDRELRWKFDQKSDARFFAYAPYDASLSGTDAVTMDFPVDQSTANGFMWANMLTAEVSASPKSTYVNLKMEHAMTAMTVSFDNRTGQNITSLTATGFQTEARLDILTGSLSGTGGKSPIIPLRSPDGSDSFCFLYPPQDVEPVFKVGFESGQTITVTYENYCHKYAGKIIRMGTVKLTESMLNDPNQNIQILPLNGISITQWSESGIPAFNVVNEYITLSQLDRVEPDANDNNFFSAYLKKVTVTAVDNTNPQSAGLILEDSTRAIHVWANEKSTLTVGNTVVGPVLGYMDKTQDGEIYISNFLASYATVSKTDTLPCTEVTVSQIRAVPRQRYEYRRVLLRDVFLKSGFQYDMAVFVQGSNEFSVVCQGMNTEMADGSKGNLIGFPVWSGDDLTLMVYDKEQFNKFSKDPIENVLTSRTEYGLYYISSMPDTAYYSFEGYQRGLQFVSGVYKNGRSLQVTSPAAGYSRFVYIYDCSDVPVLGHTYTVSFNLIGNSAESGGTVSMECVKADDERAWFIDKSSTKGLVLPL